MSTLVDTAISTSTQLPDMSLSQRNHSAINGRRDSAHPSKVLERKYNHVFAIHRFSIASPLSQDAKTTPSFVGFKNLMALMLCKKLPRLMQWE